jgi:DNA ligase-associated metallophosphoesterase
MALLAKSAPRRTPRARRGLAPPAMRHTPEGLSIHVAGVEVVMLPAGALWIEPAATLVVSDLHLEKASAYARRGHLLPPYDTRATLERLGALVERLAPKAVISLGDAFHDGNAPGRLDREDRERLAAMVKRCDWIWIEGNHDPAPPQGLGGRTFAEIEVGGLVFRHEPLDASARGEISGHLHPCARVAARGGSVRRRCFATDGARVVMPAFGAYAGGLNVMDEAFAPLFPNGCFAMMLGRTSVYPASPSRLAADA